MLRAVAAVGVAVALAGCLSSGQVEGIRMQREIHRAVAASDACRAPIREKPDYQALFRRLALEPSVPPPRPTPAQLADRSHPDRAAMRLMVAMHSDLVVCRNPLIESIARISPDLAETAVDIWLSGDRLVLSLMRREVTYRGQSPHRRRAAGVFSPPGAGDGGDALPPRRSPGPDFPHAGRAIARFRPAFSRRACGHPPADGGGSAARRRLTPFRRRPPGATRAGNGRCPAAAHRARRCGSAAG